jgi:hypothetical protein
VAAVVAIATGIPKDLTATLMTIATLLTMTDLAADQTGTHRLMTGTRLAQITRTDIPLIDTQAINTQTTDILLE